MERCRGGQPLARPENSGPFPKKPTRWPGGAPASCTGGPTAHTLARCRCFLPDLAGLAGLRRVGPGTTPEYHRRPPGKRSKQTSATLSHRAPRAAGKSRLPEIQPPPASLHQLLEIPFGLVGLAQSVEMPVKLAVPAQRLLDPGRLLQQLHGIVVAVARSIRDTGLGQAKIHGHGLLRARRLSDLCQPQPKNVGTPSRMRLPPGIFHLV